MNESVVGERVDGRVEVEVLQDGNSHTAQPEDLDALNATFAAPDLTTFCLLDELGLEAVGQRLEPERAVIVSVRRRPALGSRGDVASTSNGPTEAINGRLEHLRGAGFRNLTHYNHPVAAGSQRIQTPTTPCFVKPLTRT